MPVDEVLQHRLIDYQYSQEYLKELCATIKAFGIDNYKNIVMNYNSELELKQKTGELLTPKEIVINMSLSKSI